MRALLITTIGLMQACLAHADSDVRLNHYLSLSLEELLTLEVTISTDTPQTIARASGVVTVITAEDLKATGATNLTEALETVPGINVRASQFAFRPLVHFRGANATQTLLMVDGVPMKDLMWGFGMFWKGLPVSMIDRIEIIRGPGSALFGTDASAGVINIISRSAGTIEGTRAGLRTGSHQTHTAWLRHGADWNGFQIGLTADFGTTDGHHPRIEADAQSITDSAQGTAVSYAPGLARYGWNSQDIRLGVARGNWRLQADYSAHDDLATGITGAGVLDPTTRANDNRYNIALLYRDDNITEHWGVDAELRHSHIEYDSGKGFFERPPGYYNGSTYYPTGVVHQTHSAERGTELQVRGRYDGFAGHTIRLGIGYSNQDLYAYDLYANDPADQAHLIGVSPTDPALSPKKSRQISHLFLQDIWSLADNWELTAGARYDDYSDFGSTVNPRLALVWQTTPGLTTKLMYGRAFRAPSYQELFAQTSLSMPNPDLNPERSTTWDLAFTLTPSPDWRLSLNLYRLALSDLIASSGTPAQFQNTGKHTIRGLELEAQWQASPNLRVSGNYSLRNQDHSPYRSVFVPEQDAYLRADWSFRPDWNWNIQANWIGPRPRVTGDPRPTLRSHTLVDTTLRYQARTDLEFAASIRNLFNADARDYTSRALPNDLPLAGRIFFAEIRYSFK